MPLEVMAKADAFNYINNHTERYLFTSHEPFNALLYNPYTYVALVATLVGRLACTMA